MQVIKESFPTTNPDPEYENAQKRVRKIKKFYKELASWAGTSIFLVALDFFLSGGITWSKYPVFFWGIFMVIEFFKVLPLQKMDKQWEDNMIKKFTRKPALTEPSSIPVPEKDFSEALLRENEKEEKEYADLTEYRKLKKPWEDEDLV